MSSPTNPLIAAGNGAGATAADWRAAPVSAPGSTYKQSERTKALAERVAAAKAQRLTVSEWLCSKGLGAFFTLPFLGLTGLTTVPANTTLCVFRFGKLDRVISRPGLYYIAPGYDRIECQMGTQTQKIDNLNVIDRDGNPIIVSALLEYSVVDPAALYIACANNLTVLLNQCEQVVRSACTTLPLLGEKGHDIRSQTQEMAAAMVSELQHDASVLGVAVQRVCIVEARYAQEIAAQMLMKQQATAMVDARKAIVAGALGIVRDALTEFPTLSPDAKEKLINNLLVTLTSHQSPTAVIPLSS